MTGFMGEYAEGGGALEYYFLNKGNHHLSVLATIGTWESEKDGLQPRFGGAAYYGYGNQDRAIVGMAYAHVADTFDEYYEDNRWGEFEKIGEEEESVYAPIFMIGYQRIFSSGITFRTLVGFYYSDKLKMEPVYEVPFFHTYSLSVGYCF